MAKMNPVIAVLILIATMLIHARLTVNGKLSQNLHRACV